MDRSFDLVVVGTGVTSATASRCREAGWTVAAEAVADARDMADKGVPAATLTLDWAPLMRFKRSLVDPTPKHTEESWAKIGVEQFHGRARFVGPTTLAVGDDRLTG